MKPKTRQVLHLHKTRQDETGPENTTQDKDKTTQYKTNTDTTTKQHTTRYNSTQH